MARVATKRRKQPRTLSLAEDVIQVLEGYKVDRKVESLTSAVEEIVREWKKAHLLAQVKAYYDSLPDEEAAQEEQWGAFSESQM